MIRDFTIGVLDGGGRETDRDVELGSIPIPDTVTENEPVTVGAGPRAGPGADTPTTPTPY